MMDWVSYALLLVIIAIGALGALAMLGLGVAVVIMLIQDAVNGHRLRQYWREKHAKICSTCGYDLRATPDRCPECGHAPGR